MVVVVGSDDPDEWVMTSHVNDGSMELVGCRVRTIDGLSDEAVDIYACVVFDAAEDPIELPDILCLNHGPRSRDYLLHETCEPWQ